MTVEDFLDGLAPVLHELMLREGVGGWQAIVKTKVAPTGPWSVGCDTDPVQALRKALDGAAPPAPAAEDIFG